MGRKTRQPKLDRDSRAQLLARQKVGTFEWPTGTVPRRTNPFIQVIADDYAQTIWSSRQESDWMPFHREIVAEIGLIQTDIAFLRIDIDEKGMIIDGKKNPAVSLLDLTTKKLQSHLRLIGMGGSGIDTRSMNNRRPIQQPAAKSVATPAAAADDDVPDEIRGFLQ
ncbi:hypothetical protein [Aliiruegeria sabulilitoris]|uniref:hypothetical protein n=1 Tax=Aliiruegeria sabulilitoris TaxID=1510458 RepID=UPI00082D942E|nr:hypothetical protein [Aliiruegeria sabulilitoris]NDR56612.1 hypothetical protein [Pseudoruegeria sp. M32A2M]